MAIRIFGFISAVMIVALIVFAGLSLLRPSSSIVKVSSSQDGAIKPDQDYTISIVGDISLADNWSVMPQYDSRGKGVNGILSDEVLKVMRESDFMVANNEFTVSNRGAKTPGKYYTFRAKPELHPAPPAPFSIQSAARADAWPSSKQPRALRKASRFRA